MWHFAVTLVRNISTKSAYTNRIGRAVAFDNI